MRRVITLSYQSDNMTVWSIGLQAGHMQDSHAAALAAPSSTAL